MTTTPRKTSAHKKARAIRSGFLELINTLVLTPRQGLAGKLTLFMLVMKHHENNDSTSVIDITFARTYKSQVVWLIHCKQIGVVPCIITCII